jgi:hypothetical protein
MRQNRALVLTGYLADAAASFADAGIFNGCNAPPTKESIRPSTCLASRDDVGLRIRNRLGRVRRSATAVYSAASGAPEGFKPTLYPRVAGHTRGREKERQFLPDTL